MARAVRGRKAPEGLEVCSVADSDEFIVVTWDVSSPVSSPVSLTRAEREVLALVIEGGSNAAVARARNTSVRTVANQVASLLAKLGAGSRYDLIRRFGAPRATER